MLTPNEFNALVSILNRAPMLQAETFAIQVILGKIAPPPPQEKKDEEKKDGQ
jgi:hypothetical protein